MRKQSVPTSNSTAKRLARLGALSRFTKKVARGFFSHNIQFVFGQRCDPPSYVNTEDNFNSASSNAEPRTSQPRTHLFTAVQKAWQGRQLWALNFGLWS